MPDHRRMTRLLAALALLGTALAGLAGCAGEEDGEGGFRVHYHWHPLPPPSNASVD